jgi:hypothetical protein
VGIPHSRFALAIPLQVHVAGADAQDAPFGHGVPAIDRQVQQRRLQLRGIGGAAPQLGAELGLQLHPGADRPVDEVHRAPQQPVEVDRPGTERLPARERQQPPDQRRPPLRGVHRSVDQLHLVGLIDEPPLEQVQIADDHRQQVVEVVGHPAGELSDRLQPL